MDKMNERTRTMRLYINGGWQNFDVHIDDVRLYARALSPEEVRYLYQQPWK